MRSISRQFRRVSPFLVTALFAYCAKDALPGGPTPTSVSSPNVPAGVLVGAGDIGFCGTSGAEATARVLDQLPGTVFTAGDNAYDTGSRAEFTASYAPTSRRHLASTRRMIGYHDYGSVRRGVSE